MINNKQELKAQYKEMKFSAGVFQIRNLQNNKVYIEGSTDLVAIWNRHRFQLNNGSHRNNALQNDWNAFGEQQFVYEILSEIKQDDDMPIDLRKEVKLLEAMFLDELKPFGTKGYHSEMTKSI